MPTDATDLDTNTDVEADEPPYELDDFPVTEHQPDHEADAPSPDALGDDTVEFDPIWPEED